MSQRVGDTERQAVAQRLTDGFGTGRLSPVEYDERLILALGARTAHDLSLVVADLPEGPADERATVAARQRQDLHEWLRECWGVRSAADDDLQPFWPGVPLGIWAVVLLTVALWPADER